MDSKRKRESETPDVAEKNRETKLAKVDSSATKPDVSNYIVSGRFEEDIKRFFPDHEQEVEDDAFSHCMDLAAFLGKVKKPEARAALEKFDQLMRQGVIPESELLTHGTYGVDYVANEMLEEKGDWYFLCAAGDDTYVFNPNTGAVHFCNDEGVAPKWTFNDLDSYVYVMLRGSAVLEDTLSFTKELRDELLSLDQYCVQLVIENFLEDLLADEGESKQKRARKSKGDEEEEDDDDDDGDHQEGEKEEDDEDEESDEEESEEEETLLKDKGPVTLSKDGPKDYILSGRFEADLKTLFPSHTPKPIVATTDHADAKAFLANMKDKHHKEVFERFDSILMSGAVPRGLEFFGVGGYGFDYTAMGALDGEEPHTYYFLPNAADGALVLNAQTGVVHMVDTEEDSVSEDTFNDLDSYAYAMLRATSAGHRLSGAEVKKELESMKQSAATWVAESWVTEDD